MEDVEDDKWKSELFLAKRDSEFKSSTTSNDNLDVYETSNGRVFIKELTEVKVSNPEEVADLIESGVILLNLLRISSNQGNMVN